MRRQTTMLSRILCVLLFFIFLYGCTSTKYLENHTNEWVARPLSELKKSMSKPDSYASKIGWKETTYPLVNGNYVFVEPLDKDCSVHWEVSQRGTIVGFKTSKGCKSSSTTTSMLDEVTTPSDRW